MVWIGARQRQGTVDAENQSDGPPVSRENTESGQ